MKEKIKQLGYSLISILLFQIALSLVSIKTSTNFLQLKNYTGTTLLSSSQLYGEILVSILMIVSILIFLIKKKAGLILYIASILLSILFSIFFNKVTLTNILLSLILPTLTILLIYVKKNTLF